MKDIYRALYAAIVLHCIRRILSHKEMMFKRACIDYEHRVNEYLKWFDAQDPENKWIAPRIPFPAPEGWYEGIFEYGHSEHE